ncbi:hypothetical protein IC229_14975 [Spirosoma sp. BT702]|uniref:Uncharacterized protein n=1 Tax=Spirosoma profusum TaxID=2771354 RepID=A0A926XXG8_9BACT|nr:hypothetical protein [Spirosoma profusum]MBD2701950.1 hypothetical protein [Spirosoma profusum]
MERRKTSSVMSSISDPASANVSVNLSFFTRSDLLLFINASLGTGDLCMVIAIAQKGGQTVQAGERTFKGVDEAFNLDYSVIFYSHGN